jgi:hypothetical protein
MNASTCAMRSRPSSRRPETNPDAGQQIYRWLLARQYDTHGSANPASGNPTPANQVVYRYSQNGRISGLFLASGDQVADEMLTGERPER